MIGERRRPTEAEVLVQAVELLDREWEAQRSAKGHGHRRVYQHIHSAVSIEDGDTNLLITELVPGSKVPEEIVLIEPITRQPEYLLLCTLSDGPEYPRPPGGPSAMAVVVWRAETEGPIHLIGRSLRTGDYFNKSRQSLDKAGGVPSFPAWSSRRPELPDLAQEEIERLVLESLEQDAIKTGPFGVVLFGTTQRFIETNAALLFAGYAADLPISPSPMGGACASRVLEGQTEVFPWLLGNGADALLLLSELSGADVGEIPTTDVIRAIQLGAEPSQLRGARDTGRRRIALLFQRDPTGREFDMLPAIKHRASWVLEDDGQWHEASTSFHGALAIDAESAAAEA